MKITRQQHLRAIAKALLNGHRDSLTTRVGALAVFAEVISTREAVRQLGVSATAIYKAKPEIEEAILGQLRAMSLANEIKPPMNDGPHFREIHKTSPE